LYLAEEGVVVVEVVEEEAGQSFEQSRLWVEVPAWIEVCAARRFVWAASTGGHRHSIPS